MSLLAEWYIQLSTRGKGQADKDIDDTKKGLEKAAESSKKFEGFVKNAFTVAAGVVSGFVRAGLSGTAAGERLAYVFTQFSREVASVFLPVIQLATAALEKITDWLRNLSGSGQAAILAIGAAIATAVAVATGGLSAVLSAVVLVTAAFYRFMQATEGGRNALAKIQGIFARIGEKIGPLLERMGERISEVIDRFTNSKAFDAIVWATEKWLDYVSSIIDALEIVLDLYMKIAKFLPGASLFLGEKSQGGSKLGRQSVGGKGGGFEDAQAFYKRIQSSAVAADPVRQQLEVSKQQLEEQKKTNAKLDHIKPTYK